MQSSQISATVHGSPRIGPARELKRATESYWAGRLPGNELLEIAAGLRRDTWKRLSDAGISEVPCNDFSLYDHVLDAAVAVSAIPPRFRQEGATELETYFGMARGNASQPPLEMTKWFDTNYHYLVPELGPDTEFSANPTKAVSEVKEAQELDLRPRPVLLGPVTFLLLSKPSVDSPPNFAPLSLLDQLLDAYVILLGNLREAGAEWIQLDEPILVQDQPSQVYDAVRRAYQRLTEVTQRPKILIASYFDVLGEALPLLASSGVEGLALDFTSRAAGNIDALISLGGVPDKRLVAGVVDGRNVWTSDLDGCLALLRRLRDMAGELLVSPSCSLLHVPIDLNLEQNLDPRVRPWLAFARQKVNEIVTLADGLAQGEDAIAEQLSTNRAALADRAVSPLTHDAAVRERVAAITPEDSRRHSAFVERDKIQRARLGLPSLPTTTIGSFPQTSALREARAGFRSGNLSQADYDKVISDEIDAVIDSQQKIGLDVLVHGEPERNDMVQYFAEQLAGFLATTHGWVQSYGTRYVRPPILVGDVSRPEPMTIRWTTYAQSRTNRPVKGMLTGPVTMLCWSFVRDDQPLAETARQVALALRDEVLDLEKADIHVVQVDEPALREGLPLRSSAHKEYLEWATQAFRLATSGVRDETQIHTHMCYAEFGEILPTITALDADVISLEAARSRMEILEDLRLNGYTHGVGPGVYDIHSPRVPSEKEIIALIEDALRTMPVPQLWINPDCGLKTRAYEEVVPALTNMVNAARRFRATD